MKTRRIGQNGPDVPCLGIGAMSFSDFYGVTTYEESAGILDAALSAGITHIDTANIYGQGRSEKVIGQFLKERPGVREQFHIATKAGITTDANGNRCFVNDPSYLEAELDKSLQRLGVDCVDLFYVHRRDVSRPIEEVTRTLADLVAKGKCKAFGFSEIAPSSLRRAHAVHPVAAVQSEYSLATRLPELGLIQACKELGTTFVAFSPVSRSLLTDRPVGKEAIANSGFLKINPRFIAPNHAANLAQTDRFRALAAEMGAPAASLAIAWVLAKGDHILPIPGTRSVRHFEELVRGARLELSEGDVARIEAVLPVGWAHGDRYVPYSITGVESYC